MKKPKLFQGTILNREQFEANLKRYRNECAAQKPRPVRSVASKPTVKPIKDELTHHERYRKLLESSPVAAGEYWRANKESIYKLMTT